MKWIEEHKLTSVIIVMLIIWFSLLSFWFLKADEITKDPCSICAERHGEKILCTTNGIYPITRSYETNGTIYDNTNEIVKQATQELAPNYTKLNLTKVNPLFTK